MKVSEWLDSLATFKGFPNIAIGWPKEEYMDKGNYETEEEMWADEEKDMEEFSTDRCDLCGSYLAGARHVATALPDSPAEDSDYIALSVCTDCIMFLANGDIPDWLEED